ncbi:hypothetical protein IT411_03640 [Candidatus Peregrinibacteria bacterium]|nr:hypothetical protein [Candidatus Peregrinibacteria bacterium]
MSLELVHNVDRGERIAQLIDGEERLGHDWAEVLKKILHILEVTEHFENIGEEINNPFYIVITLIHELKQQELAQVKSKPLEGEVVLEKLHEEGKKELNKRILLECQKPLEHLDENELRENALFILDRLKKLMEALDRKLLILTYNYEEYLDRGKFKGPYIIELMRHSYSRLGDYLAVLKKIAEQLQQVTRQHFMPMQMNYSILEEAFSNLYHCLNVLSALKVELKTPSQLREPGLIPRVLDQARVIPYTAEQMAKLSGEKLLSVEQTINLRFKYIKALTERRIVEIIEGAQFKRVYLIDNTGESKCANLGEVLADFSASFTSSSHNYELTILKEIEAALEDRDLGEAEQLLRMYLIYTNDCFEFSQPLRDEQFLKWQRFEKRYVSLTKGNLSLIEKKP